MRVLNDYTLPPVTSMLREWPALTTIVTGFVSVVSYLFGQDTELLGILATLLLLDFVTGFMAAWVNKELSSRQGLVGIVRKLGTLSALILAHMIDRALGEGAWIQTATCVLLITNEGVSIVENLAVLGVPVPAPLREALAVLQRRGEVSRVDP